MKTLYTLLFATAIVLAPAAQAEGVSIAIVNVQKIMHDAAAAKSASDQLEKKQKSYQDELKKKDDALQKEEQELTKQKNVLSKEAFEEKTRAFRGKVTDIQKEVQSKKALLDNAYARALADIQKAVTDIIADMAKEKGFTLAIPTSQLLYAENKLDISDEVLSRLNKKLPKLDVKFEAR